jgi:hypothetical protein
MNALTKSLAAAAILSGAFLSAPAQALPTCATAGGMTIKPPGAAASISPDSGACIEISGGYNWAYSGYTADEAEAFRQILATQWGGSASDWVYLREIDGRSDSIIEGDFPEINPTSFDVWTGGQINFGASRSSGEFSVTIADSTVFPTPFETRNMQIVGVMKPDDANNPGDKSSRNSYADTVLAYLFSSVQVTERGEMTGTFSFQSSTTAPSSYVYSGLGFFGRVAPTVAPTPIPEPAVLALIGIAAVGASIARGKQRS